MPDFMQSIVSHLDGEAKNMGKLLVRFLFKQSPHSLDVVLGEVQAKEMVAEVGCYLAGQVAGGDTGLRQGWDEEQRRLWALHLSQVSAVLAQQLTEEELLSIRQKWGKRAPDVRAQAQRSPWAGNSGY